ncbi:cytochrome oxidase putative small subunit CydP [Legionella maceachernii]|uniref:cytochrome oxidase putative small subunit CydP n=1 Tax=Legionella maceachernii TaxID=466 RepID=UPI0039860E25
MKSIRRDIQITLLVKLVFLFVLWWVCFKGGSKTSMIPQNWLTASSMNSQSTLSTR